MRRVTRLMTACAATTILWAVTTLWGCTPRPPPPRLVQVKVALRGPATDGTATEQRLAARIAQRLGESRLLPVALGEKARDGIDYRVTVEAELMVALGESAVPSLRAQISASLSRVAAPVDEPPVVENLVAERQLDAGKPAQRPDEPPAAPHGDLDSRVGELFWKAHLARAVDDATAGLIARGRIRLGGPTELSGALGSDGGELREEALSTAALRRDASSVPAIIELLHSDDERTRDLALGALVAIGDARAVKPIEHLATLKDVDQLPKVIDALAALGGDDARAYLAFIASGHDDPEIQSLSRRAIERLDRRRNSAPDP